jgi:hypothetical protein
MEMGGMMGRQPAVTVAVVTAARRVGTPQPCDTHVASLSHRSCPP